MPSKSFGLERIVEGMELDSLSRASINVLPLEYSLPQIATILTQAGTSPKSSAQLLSISHRLAQQSNAIATSIVSAPKFFRASSYLRDPLQYNYITSLLSPLVKTLRKSRNMLTVSFNTSSYHPPPLIRLRSPFVCLHQPFVRALTSLLMDCTVIPRGRQ